MSTYLEGEVVSLKGSNAPVKIEEISPRKLTVKYTDQEDIDKHGDESFKVNRKDVKTKSKKIVIKRSKIKSKTGKTKKVVTRVEPIDWTQLNEKAFPSWINETFEVYRLPKKAKKPTGDGFEPFPYQMFIRDYMQERSPYRGILLYHGLGTGKTCSAIETAENLKHNKDVIVLLPASLIPNFVEDGLKFCGDKRYKDAKKLSELDPYIFVSYNATNTLKQLENIGTLDDKVVIIEEVHNLISMVANDESKKGKAIYQMLMDAKNCKIVALSGTPVVNQPYEMGVLLNILRGYIEVARFNIDKIGAAKGRKWNYLKMEEDLKELDHIDFVETNLKNRTIEIHFRYKSWQPEFEEAVKDAMRIATKHKSQIRLLKVDNYTLFPESEEEFNKIFIDSTNPKGDKLKHVDIMKRRMAGLISYYSPAEANYPEVEIHEPVHVPMSNYQFSHYRTIAKAEKKSVMGRKFRIYTRQLSNFVFPPGVVRPGFDEVAALLRPDSERKKKTDVDEEATQEDTEISKKQKKAIDKALTELEAGSAEYFSIEGLEKYSPKMLDILEKIEASPGLVFVYSDFRTLEGVGIFALVLKQHGYVPFDPKDPTKKKTFALYSGSEDMKTRKATLKMFRDPKNKTGDYIKVVLATKAGAEGLDLKNIRQIHIMDPYWNEVRIDQVIGRGVRRKSHFDLPEEDRKVDVYRYLAVFDKAQEGEMGGVPSTDEQIYEIALKKKIVTDEILTLMKEVSVDCMLNLKQNPPVRCHSYGDDTEGLAYLPQLRQDLAFRPKETMVVVKRDLALAGIDQKKNIYLIDTRKRALFKIDDVGRKNPVKPRPKIRKKVWVDLEHRLVYDYEYAKAGADQPPIGQVNENGRFVKA